ncbi:hypothetical protein BT69DRAFT_1277618 [Atractiella rhizophila]|nr:hypothetical protein BT69DRAFT_1277618 [Atractiella rhizophila]
MSPLQTPAAGEERPSTLMMKRSSSLAVKAGKWTGALKDGLKDVHIPGNKKKLSKTPEEGTTTDAPPKTPPKETSEAEATANTDSATQPAPA